jgi:hypothetical protein
VSQCDENLGSCFLKKILAMKTIVYKRLGKFLLFCKGEKPHLAK